MENVFKKLVKENKEEIEKYTNELKKVGFTDKDIKECRYIYNLRNKLMFRKIDNGVCEDSEISYDNGFTKGLYTGAKMQLRRIVDELLNDKIYEVIAHIDVDADDIWFKTKKLDTALSVRTEIITLADAYDENIAVIGQKEYHDFTEEYYILARKDKNDKKYEYLMIDLDGLHQDYKPTEAELELFK